MRYIQRKGSFVDLETILPVTRPYCATGALSALGNDSLLVHLGGDLDLPFSHSRTS